MEKIEVYHKVIGKGRPRFVRRGQYVSTYTPKETGEYEKKIKEVYLYGKHKKFENEPLKVKIMAYYKPPESMSKRKKEELIKKHHWRYKKPDIDNIAKVVCDALNGVAYNDDKQIAMLFITKQYGEEDKIVIEIDELGVQNI